MIRDTGRTTVALATGTTIAGSMPAFLVGAVFVQLQADIGAENWVLGTAVAAYWIAAAVISTLSGRIVARIGSRRGTILSLVVSIVSLLGVALWVPSWQWLVVWTVVGGMSNGLGHPSSNHLMTLRVGASRWATAFGIKQGAVPFAAFGAGLTVPTLAVTLGWQWGYALGALGAAAVLVAFLLLGPRRVPAASGARKTSVPLTVPLRRYLLVLLTATTLGSAGAGAVASFAVTAGVDRGIPDALAGVLLSAGSLLGATLRVIAGRLADRSNGRTALPMTAAMLACGAIGTVLMSLGSVWTFAIGVLFVLGPGWGWAGLTHFVVSRVAGPATPSATGIVQTGSYLGSAGGPFFFGLAFQFTSGDPAVWWGVAVAQIVATAIVVVLLRRAAPPTPTAPG